jgi:hypothetical protein
LTRSWPKATVGLATTGAFVGADGDRQGGVEVSSPSERVYVITAWPWTSGRGDLTLLPCTRAVPLSGHWRAHGRAMACPDVGVVGEDVVVGGPSFVDEAASFTLTGRR